MWRELGALEAVSLWTAGKLVFQHKISWYEKVRGEDKMLCL